MWWAAPGLPRPAGAGAVGGGQVSVSLPSWGLSCLPHSLTGLSLNQGGWCLTGLVKALCEDKSPQSRSHAVASPAVGPEPCLWSSPVGVCVHTRVQLRVMIMHTGMTGDTAGLPAPALHTEEALPHLTL